MLPCLAPLTGQVAVVTGAGAPGSGRAAPGGRDEPCLRVCGLTCLLIPARRMTCRTIRAAPCRSSRRLSALRKSGPFGALIDGQVDRPCGAGCQRDGDHRAARAGDDQGAVPAFQPSCSIPAPVASETRCPLRASSEVRACSAGGPSPAATRIAPSSLRSSAVACDSSSSRADASAPGGTVIP
jgi:hypothetical protein